MITCLVVAGVLFAVQTYLAALLTPMSAAELAAARVSRVTRSTPRSMRRWVAGCTTWWR